MNSFSYFLLLSAEIPDFMSPEEADHIVKLAEDVGFLKSDIHLDPVAKKHAQTMSCLLYTSPSPRDLSTSRMPSSA